MKVRKTLKKWFLFLPFAANAIVVLGFFGVFWDGGTNGVPPT